MSALFLVQAIVGGVLVGGIYALVALGLNIIFGVMKVINFAHGAMMMLAMYMTFWLFQAWSLDPYAGGVVTVAALFAFGWVLERSVVAPLMGKSENSHLLLTLGLSLVLENLALAVFGPQPKTVQTVYSQSAIYLDDLSVSVPRLVAFLVAMAFSGLAYLILEKTDLGKAMRAVAEERTGAMLTGIPIKRVYGFAFALGTACAGVAGVLMTPFFYVSHTIGATFTTIAFIVVVLGGMGSPAGAVVGGIVIGVVESLGAALLPGSLKQLVMLAVFVLVLLFKPEGIWGKSNG